MCHRISMELFFSKKDVKYKNTKREIFLKKAVY